MLQRSFLFPRLRKLTSSLLPPAHPLLPVMIIALLSAVISTNFTLGVMGWVTRDTLTVTPSSTLAPSQHH